MLINRFVTHMKSVLPDFVPSVILDIGSRDLDQSIEFSSVYPDAKIYAFEPNPAQYNICQEKANNYPNVIAEQLAISSAIGTLDFYVTHGNVGASSLLEPIAIPFASSNEVTKISVSSTRLDIWLETNKIETVDVMWLDTQGVELDALKGMGEKLMNVKFIHCEASELPYYKGHLLKNELVEFLTDSGFDLIFINEAYHPYNEGDIIATNKRFL